MTRRSTVPTGMIEVTTQDERTPLGAGNAARGSDRQDPGVLMAVSKRTRYEVLRRDQYRCRYCHSTENPLTVDHVIPVALGGTDDPSNLVAACKDCNAGKSSGSPDAGLVADVSDDTVRWAAAIAEVGRRANAERTDAQARLTHFKEHVWDSWLTGKGVPCKLPIDWEFAITRQFDAGLTLQDLEYAVKQTMVNTWVTDEFRYFMGVCKTMTTERMDAARNLINNGEV